MKDKVYVRISQLFDAYNNCLKTGNDYRVKHEREIRALVKKYLPQGGGFINTIFSFKESKSSKLVFSTTFYRMNDYGYYTKNKDYKIIVTPNFGGIDIKIKGRNINQIKDYMGDCFYECLTTEVEDNRV